jgi:hypothetical protein
MEKISLAADKILKGIFLEIVGKINYVINIDNFKLCINNFRKRKDILYLCIKK